MQQDAHEFLNFLINHINEIILAERNQGKTKTSSNGVTVGESASSNSSSPNTEPTWVQDIFQGVLTSETRCLNCETISSKDENFFDLQVDVDQNTSITHCLRCFSNTETLCSDNKFKCDNCCSYQEAQKRMRVKKLPMILALQLKRFKYMEQYNRHIKVSHRVVFPLELRLFNTVRRLVSDLSLDCSNTRYWSSFSPTTLLIPIECTIWWLSWFTADRTPTGDTILV